MGENLGAFLTSSEDATNYKKEDELKYFFIPPFV